MCGIFSVFYDDKVPDGKDRQKLISGFNTLYKRGPDNGSLKFTDKIVYGFRRLSIVDPDNPLANQPFEEDNCLLMCNGEIYNHQDLKKKYGLQTKTDNDCECLIQLYKKIGFQNMTEKLDGVFAIVLIDFTLNMIYIARDRIGVRPLFLGYSDGLLAIASIASALVPFCDKVHQFEPDIVAMSLINKRIISSNKWTLPDFNKNKIHTNVSSKIRKTLIQAVRKRLHSDRPIGCFLSGGLDSSIVASILVEELGKDNVKTYSIGMKGSTDLKYAKMVADYLGTVHTEVLFTIDEGFEAIREVIQHLESYDITTVRASVGMHLLSSYISENTNDVVIFSGEGADELLCGYLYFHNAPDAGVARKEAHRLLKRLPHYDVLRADRCVSSHGLELRVPFLDKDFVDFILSLDPKLTTPTDGRMEKHLIREAFAGYLPDKVLWRRKEGFSDGVSGLEKPWYVCIQEKVEALVSEKEKKGFPSKEAAYYFKIFSELFPTYKIKDFPGYWMPQWSDATDPSGRCIPVFDEK